MIIIIFIPHDGGYIYTTKKNLDYSFSKKKKHPKPILMKGLKRFLWLFLALMTVFVLFLFWYQYKYSMDVAEPYEVNAKNWNKRLLIATQGSDFKNAVTKGIVDHFRPDSIFIQVVDIQALAGIEPEDYDGLVLLHTWENWKPPDVVKSFIERTKKYKARIIVLTTSGEGNYKMDGVDAITGESIIENASLYVEKIVKRLEPLMERQSKEDVQIQKI